MSGFDPSWLALREPYDHAVRDPALTKAFVEALGPSSRLVDLGCGTGSNLRCLVPHLPPSQSWICIDHDPVLLKRLEETRPAGAAVKTSCMDLAAGFDAIPIEPHVGVTAAALLDLVSDDWLRHLALRCREAPVLMALSFDGRVAWDPVDPIDEAVRIAFCRHQRSDKGFGPALGPEAVDAFANHLRGVGHDVRLARSDWVFGAGDGSILKEMVDGILAAAEEADPSLPLKAWCLRRRQEIAAGDLSLTVGHLDLLGLP